MMAACKAVAIEDNSGSDTMDDNPYYDLQRRTGQADQNLWVWGRYSLLYTNGGKRLAQAAR
jgi:hypothetical protein